MRCCPPHRDARGDGWMGYGRCPFLSTPLAAANTRQPQSILRPKAEQNGIATLGCASLGRLRCSVPARHDRLLACPGYCTAALRGQTHYGMDIPVPTVGISRSGPAGRSASRRRTGTAFHRSSSSTVVSQCDASQPHHRSFPSIAPATGKIRKHYPAMAQPARALRPRRARCRNEQPPSSIYLPYQIYRERHLSR